MYELNGLMVETYIYTSSTADDNEVYVPKTIGNINRLCRFGCTNTEIENLNVSDGLIEVYPLMRDKGYKFKPEKGFYRS